MFGGAEWCCFVFLLLVVLELVKMTKKPQEKEGKESSCKKIPVPTGKLPAVRFLFVIRSVTNFGPSMINQMVIFQLN